jgi:HEPN domain-containing protein
MLKAIIVKRTSECPPRLHNLMRLAESAGIEVDEARADFLRELSAYFIQSRYPEEMLEASQVSAELSEQVLARAKEVMQWLSSML